MCYKTIYVLGDSISKGIVQDIEPGKKYSVYENNAWSVFARKNGINLINKSVFGSTITKGHRTLTKDLASGIAPDAIVIEFGGNDSDYRWPDLFTNGENNFFPNTSLEDFVKHLSEMISEIKESKLNPVLMTLPPLVGKRYFDMISEGLNKEALLNWMGDYDFLYREQELYSNVVAQYARENGIFLLDLRKEFLLERKCQSFIGKDGIHPNIEGHAFIAEYLDRIYKETDFNNL